MIVWERRSAGNHYQVRRAGASVRLYRNGVFHSQYNSRRLLNGGVWDMLWLPVFFRPLDTVRKVLVLGVGAGAAIRKLVDYLPAVDITAVDIDAVHLTVARRFVGLRSSKTHRIRLHQADAIDWLMHGGKYLPAEDHCFDLIVDDLFGEMGGEPVRAVSFLASRQAWLRQLRRKLADDGLLVANCVSRPEARALVRGQPAATSASFRHGYLLGRKHYDNAVCVASPAPLALSEWGEHLASVVGPTGQRQARASMRVTRLK